MNPSKERLIRELAAQAGLVLRNVRLIEELRASRQRLVAAQDEERRKLERDLHDGAQQQLVALAVQLQARPDDARARPDEPWAACSTQLQARPTDALTDLRDLARGIYPPLLADQGLRRRARGAGAKSAVPTSVRRPTASSGTPRRSRRPSTSARSRR